MIFKICITLLMMSKLWILLIAEDFMPRIFPSPNNTASKFWDFYAVYQSLHIQMRGNRGICIQMCGKGILQRGKDKRTRMMHNLQSQGRPRENEPSSASAGNNITNGKTLSSGRRWKWWPTSRGLHVTPAFHSAHTTLRGKGSLCPQHIERLSGFQLTSLFV